MAIKDGICEYCGQAVLQGKDCDCEFSQKEQKIKKKIAEANENIDFLFSPEYNVGERISNFLKQGVNLLANDELKSVTVKLHGDVSAKLNLDAKDNLTITRTILEKDSLQVTDK